MRRLPAPAQASRWARGHWTGLAVAALVVAAAATRTVLNRRFAAPVVLCDEFIYSNLAKNLAEHGHFLLRGTPKHQSYLYPLLLAPAWFAHSMSTTYALAKGITASAMALTPIPVYLWARRLVTPIHALLAAALTLLLPALFYSGVLMTEGPFLPAFVLALAKWQTLGPFVLIAGGLTGIHIFALNLIAPQIVGRKVRLNAVAITIALLFWGWVWGGMGLVLAIPITATLRVICDHTESWKPIGRWLSA